MQRIVWLLLLLIVLTSCSTYKTQQESSHPSRALANLLPHYARVQHGQIEYYQLGHGRPIILIPGYLTDVTSWDKVFLAELAKEHQLIILNNRNVGGSLIQSFKYQSQDLARDISQLITKLHLQKPIILGISMGGMIAQQVAVSSTQQIGGVVLINTAIAGKQSVAPDPLIVNKVLNMPNTKWGRYQLALELFFPPTWRMQAAYALVFERFIPKQYQEIDLAALKLPQQILLMQWSSNDIIGKKLKHIQIPALILNGTSDAVIPPINSIILKRTLPNSQLYQWKEGGHAMIYQYPIQMAELINQFIAQI